MRRKLIPEIFVALMWFFSFVALASAYEDDFGAAKKIEGKHFVVYYGPQLDLYVLLQQLNIGLGDTLLLNEPAIKGDDFSMALDTFYGRIAHTLDMNLYSLQCNLKICRDDNHLRSVARAIFSRDYQGPSFYVNELNTIYISADHFTKEVLGHEIAHMIISHYFVVQPPAKVAEILAGYVEYELHKSSP
jgi:hypothetical protein